MGSANIDDIIDIDPAYIVSRLTSTKAVWWRYQTVVGQDRTRLDRKGQYKTQHGETGQDRTRQVS